MAGPNRAVFFHLHLARAGFGYLLIAAELFPNGTAQPVAREARGPPTLWAAGYPMGIQQIDPDDAAYVEESTGDHAAAVALYALWNASLMVLEP